MTALAIGFAAGSLGQRVVGAASAGHRAESALLSVFESIRPKRLNHSASLVHVASLETNHRPRAPQENGLRLRRHRSIRSHRTTMIAAPRSMILLRVRSTCRMDAGWKRIRAWLATWTMLAMCT